MDHAELILEMAKVLNVSQLRVLVYHEDRISPDLLHIFTYVNSTRNVSLVWAAVPATSLCGTPVLGRLKGLSCGKPSSTVPIVEILVPTVSGGALVLLVIAWYIRHNKP